MSRDIGRQTVQSGIIRQIISLSVLLRKTASRNVCGTDSINPGPTAIGG